MMIVVKESLKVQTLLIMNYIGIDISSTFFHVAVYDSATNQHKVKEWAYEHDSHLENFANSLNQSTDWCVMEATGNFHLRLAYWLVENGFKVSIVNPLSVKRYRQMKGSISKTDKADAIFIAKYAESERDSLALYKIPSEALSNLSQRRMLLNSLENQLQVVSNQLYAISMHPKVDSFTKDFLSQHQESLKEQIVQVRQNISQLINQDYSSQKELLLSIPGFGEVTSNTFIEVVNTFDGIEKDNAVKSFSKYVGLAPTIEQSGKSVRKKATIARASTTLLRTKLYLPAMTICLRTKSDNIFKTFYLKLRSGGKSFKEAIVAVMHKMVRIAIAILKSKTKFDSEFGEKNEPLIIA